MITINDKINQGKLSLQTQIFPTILDAPNTWIIASPQHVQQLTKEKAR
jgi:hypothetical protein